MGKELVVLDVGKVQGGQGACGAGNEGIPNAVESKRNKSSCQFNLPWRVKQHGS